MAGTPGVEMDHVNGPLTVGQVAHFHTFGYVHLRAVFSQGDIAALTRRADELIATSTPEERALEAPGTQPYFLEPVLGREHVIGAVTQLMASLGEHRFLYKGDAHLAQRPGYESSGGTPEHGWHSDIPGPAETAYPRIKGMVYLTPTTREHGAIRFIAGSHREEMQRLLRPLQGCHVRGGLNYYGVAQNQLPSVVVESMPGDFILFHQSLFHYVYNHRPERRLIQCSWAGYPDTPERLASCWRNAWWPFSARQHGRFKDHPDPRIRSMCLLPHEAVALRAAAETANLSAPFPDVDVNGTTWAIEHRARSGQQSWMESFLERTGANNGQCKASL